MPAALAAEWADAPDVNYHDSDYLTYVDVVFRFPGHTGNNVPKPNHNEVRNS